MKKFLVLTKRDAESEGPVLPAYLCSPKATIKNGVLFTEQEAIDRVNMDGNAGEYAIFELVPRRVELMARLV